MSKHLEIDGIEVFHFMSWIEKWSKELPLKPAIKGMGEVFTYSELDRMTDAVGEYLLSKGVKVGDVVLVEMERHIDVFLAIIGAWKIRAAFAYVDAVAPTEQKEMIAADSGAKFVIKAKEIAEIKEKVRSGHVAPDYPVGEMEDLAWILLTSGSTGRSKGVIIYQKNVALHLMISEILGTNINDNQSMLASFSFMSGLMEGFPILTKGGTLHMLPGEARRDLDLIEKFIRENDISLSFLPAHFAEAFVREGRGGPKFRLLTTGGEPVHHIKSDRPYQVMCLYGSSETGGPATYKYIESDEYEYSVGKPFPMLKIYLLKDDLSPVTEVGEVGEICFSGQVISGGYSNRPDLTAEKFVKNPFSDDPNYSVLYHTGDLAKLNEDGEFVYVCRADLMCKIRSFRIELGEVEGCMSKYPGIDRCLVKPMTRESDMERELHGFYFAPGVDINEDELRAYMRDNLLHYKVPKYFHRIDSVPVTDNGKINRERITLEGYIGK